MPLRPVGIVVLALAASLSSACRENEPEDRYNRTFDVGGRTLLPTTGSMHLAYDERILQGQQKATIVKREDFLAGTVPAPVEDAPAAIAPPASVEEALSSVGKAFLGTLRGEPAPSIPGGPDATASPESTTESETAATPGATEAAPPGAGLPAEDAQAIAALVDQFNKAYAARDFEAIAPLCVASQKTVARDFFELRADLSASLDTFWETSEKTDAGAKARGVELLSRALTPYVLTDLANSTPDSASGTLERAEGRERLAFGFEKEDGQWRLIHPHVPSSADWPGVETVLQKTIDELDELTDAMATGGAVDQSKAQQVIQDAVKLMFEAPPK